MSNPQGESSTAGKMAAPATPASATNATRTTCALSNDVRPAEVKFSSIEQLKGQQMNVSPEDGIQGMDEEYELRIHCEVALTLYLREHWKGIRETTGINFVTKGCHHKWYFPWGFPQQQSHHLRVAAYTAIGNALGSDIYARGWAFLRTYSDSLAISIDSTAVSKEEEDDSNQRLKAIASHSNY
ncbi:hypothetical protein EV426DRAFT_704484 [Tirmania nivea]|nr:hypothetical protein EV426DRAFT_704484 [Tirmania nivea]